MMKGLYLLLSLAITCNHCIADADYKPFRFNPSKLKVLNTFNFGGTCWGASAGGKFILVDDGANMVVIDTSTGKQVCSTPETQNGTHDAVIFSDGSMFAVSDNGGGDMVVYSVKDKKEIFNQKVDGSYVCSFEFSVDGKKLVTGGGTDHMLRIFDLATGKQQNSIASNLGIPYACFLSPSGDYAVAALYNNGNAGDIGIWDIKKGTLKSVASFTLFPKPHVQFSPDGKSFWVNDNTGKLLCFSLETGNQTANLDFNKKQVMWHTMVRGSALEACLLNDGTIALADTSTNKIVNAGFNAGFNFADVNRGKIVFDFAEARLVVAGGGKIVLIGN